MQRLIVTLDGPAGSGKSTVARQLAQRLQLDFLDTGAMYRGLTARALDRGIDILAEGYAVVEMARHAELAFDWAADPPRLLIQGLDMTERLRDRDVTAFVSDVAAMPAVRHVLVDAQRDIGRHHPGLVTEGRDQGSVVFPDAEVKFYLDASAQIRAERRAGQLRELGKPFDLEAIREAIILRDRKDSTRSIAPLICPEDARRIETSDMDLGRVVNLLEQTVRSALPGRFHREQNAAAGDSV